MDFRINFGEWIESGKDWIENNLDWLLSLLGNIWNWLYDTVNWVFGTPPSLVVVLVLGALALIARGWKFALGTVVGLLFILGVNQWENAMDTISLVVVATFLALIVAIPLGIWAARNTTVSTIVKPIMDFLQTMPAFVYLIPAIAFFGIGVAPGIFATVLFSLAPGVRLTELGIRSVDHEVVEAGQAFGASPRRILRQIQIPLAMPSIMAGVNQVIMLSLSMVVIAGMVGAGGLGGDVARAVSALDIAIGAEAGISVVILAIILDRFTGAFGNKRSKTLFARFSKRRAGEGSPPEDSEDEGAHKNTEQNMTSQVDADAATKATS